MTDIVIRVTLCACCLVATFSARAAAPPSGGEPVPSCATSRDLDDYLAAQAQAPASKRTSGLERAALPVVPVVSSQDGVLLVEDAGVVLRDDRIFDLPLDTIELVPAGDGYEVSLIPSAYVPVNGLPVFTGATGWQAAQIALGVFEFPFGGEPRSTFWVTTSNMISFEAPSEPVKIGLCTEGCYFAEGHVLLDRLPRISPLQHGTFLYGRNVTIQGDASHAVVTWQYDNPANLDVQVVLFPDGRIHLNYKAVAGIEFGAPTVVTGNESFWADLRLGGDVQDPAGDLPIPPPDDAALDFLGATVRQVGTSELLQVDIDLAGPPPTALVPERLFYRIELRDRALDPEPVGVVQLQWQRGRFYYVTEPVELDGSRLRLNLPLWGLPLTGGDVHLTFTTFRGDGPFEDGDSMEVTAAFAPPEGPLMLDLSDDLPVTLDDRPIYEAFTLPALQTGEVLAAVAPLFEDVAPIETFPIFQDLQTDLFFFGGGYHAGGNNGVDGTGYGTSAEPRSPGLLHLNNVALYDDEEASMLVLNHEFAHRWLYGFAIEEDGAPSRALNPADDHPAGWVHTPAVRPVYRPADYSVMGGSNWFDYGDGTFRSPTADKGGSNGFSWHELYLMGLASPEETDDWWYIRDPSPPLPDRYWAPNDTLVSGERVPVTVEQIVAAEGSRVPAYPDAVRDFLSPLVLVVRPGQDATGALAKVNELCDTWAVRFHEATGFRGTMRCRFHPPSVAITAPAADVSVFAGDTVEFTAAGTDADGDAVELRWSFPGAAPAVTGAGPHPVTFSSTGLYEARVTGVDASGMFATGDATVSVTVECPGTPPSDTIEGLRLDLEDENIRLTWTDLGSPPTDYVILASSSPTSGFLPVGSAVTGSPGALVAIPAGIAFYQVAARQDPGCLGPY